MTELTSSHVSAPLTRGLALYNPAILLNGADRLKAAHILETLEA